MFARFVFASLLGLLAVQSANAQNIVANPGFETGDFTSWTLSANASFTGVGATSPYSSTFSPHSGSYFAYLGSQTTTNSTVSQALTTTPGQTYTLSYWVIGDGDTANEFNAQINGTVIPGSDLVVPSQPWTQYTFTFTGSGSDTLAFLDYCYDTSLGLDDISVVPAATTPEPTSLGLGCLVAMGLVARYRRRSV